MQLPHLLMWGDAHLPMRNVATMPSIQPTQAMRHPNHRPKTAPATTWNSEAGTTSTVTGTGALRSQGPAAKVEDVATRQGRGSSGAYGSSATCKAE